MKQDEESLMIRKMMYWHQATVKEEVSKSSIHRISDQIGWEFIFETDNFLCESETGEVIGFSYDYKTQTVIVMINGTVIYDDKKSEIYDTTPNAQYALDGIFEHDHIEVSKITKTFILMVLVKMKTRYQIMTDKLCGVQASVKYNIGKVEDSFTTAFATYSLYKAMTIPLPNGTKFEYTFMLGKLKISIERSTGSVTTNTFKVNGVTVLVLRSNMRTMDCLSKINQLKLADIDSNVRMLITDLMVKYADDVMPTYTFYETTEEVIKRFTKIFMGISIPRTLYEDIARILFRDKHAQAAIKDKMIYFTGDADTITIDFDGVTSGEYGLYDTSPEFIAKKFTDDIETSGFIRHVIEMYTRLTKDLFKMADEFKKCIEEDDFASGSRTVSGDRVEFIGNPGIKCNIEINGKHITEFKYTAFLHKDEVRCILKSVKNAEDCYKSKVLYYFIGRVFGLYENY